MATVAGLIAAIAFAQPAFADDGADLSVRFAGTTIAANAGGKFGKVTVRNDGPGTSTGVEVTYDLSALDASKVTVNPAGCTVVGDEMTCSIADGSVPPAGGEAEFIIPLQRQAGASGAAGSITATISSADTDPNPSNNSQTVNVNVGNSGADLLVVAFDVYTLDENGDLTTDPVPPGGSSEVQTVFFNFGDMAAEGVKITVNLPEHVTFATTEQFCTNSADARSTECVYDVVFPAPGVGLLEWPVNVLANAPGPIALQGGLVTIEALGVVEVEVPAIRNLPPNMKMLDPTDAPDVDPSDNEDPFAVFVATPPDLPVTGFRTGLYAVSGAGLLLLGALIVVLARRRRRAVTPA